MMNIAQSIRRMMIVAVFALIAVGVAGAETAGERYIVILKSRSGPAPDVARLGGTISFRQEEQVNVTMPREALAALRADPLVRYIQAEAGAGDAPLAGELEEPTPGARRRLVPHATAGNQSWSRSYTYDDSGNIINIGDQQFVYDALGRLTEMATAGTATETYEYDRYGNQTKRTSGGVEHPIATDTATNRLSTGYSYDPGGNVTSGNSYTLTYDALGQAATKTYSSTTTFNETYIYTAAEERIGVQTSNSGETSSWWYWSVRDEGGKVLRQYRSSALDPTQTALWIEDYVYRDGMLVGAERPATLGGRRHFHLDHLGSPRLITSNDGQIVSSHDYLPFGGETTTINQETGAGFDREDPMKFTGHERDYAGGYGREEGGDAIDYMHARYFSSSMGRFLSVDPLDGDPSRPQSLNRYTYVSNSPINFTDPLGLASQGGTWGAPGNVDCPPGTEGISCFTTTAPDPEPPQLPKEPIVRQTFFWDRDDAPDGMRIDRKATAEAALRRRADRGDEFAMMQLGQPIPGLEEDVDTEMLVAGGVIGFLRAAVRTGASNLAEQLTLEEAEAGAGHRIMEGAVRDPRYPEHIWAKMQHVHVNPDGTKIVIHYWNNLLTGAMKGFKFK
jgi:RHS repeat-associated protein